MMKTVPTLCATGSIVGAASVGWSFGQARTRPVTYQSPDSTKRSSAHFGDTPPSQSAGSAPGSNLEAGSNWSSRNPTPSSSQASPIVHTSSRDADKIRVGFSATPSRSTNGTPSTTDWSSNPLQRRPSRLHRLASYTFNFNSSPAGSLDTNSKSLTDSSGFRPPIVPLEPQSSPLPPNKLVKRSLSQHLTNRRSISDVSDGFQLLDRPATRHRRLATLSRRSVKKNENQAGASSTSKLPRLYQPFFHPKVPSGRSTVPFRNKRAAQENTTIRRIYSSSTDQPILLLADSVSPFTVEIDFSLPTDTETFTFGGRPSTSSDIVQFLSSPGPRDTFQTPELAHVSEGERPFSPSDLLPRAPLTDGEPTRLRSSKGRRITSAPAFSMHDGRSPGMSEPSQKKRNAGKSRTASGPPSDANPTREQYMTSTARSPGTRQHGPKEKRSYHLDSHPTTPLRKGDSPASNVSAWSVSRPSATPSDITSSQIGSDVDGKVFSSGDEDDGDKQSDSVYDSLRTGATRSSSGFRGPALETLFDKEPDRAPSNHTPKKNTEGGETVSTNPRVNLEEDGNISTPSRTVILDGRGSRRSSENHNVRTPTISSSPPPLPEPLNLGELGWDSDLGDDEHTWSEEDDEEDWGNDLGRVDIDQDASTANASQQIDSSERPLKYFRPQRASDEQDQKNNLFDWSEQQPLQRSLEDKSPPRPKTVHGKKNRSGRGSRASGRRAPSGLHARSQSVPALADLAGTQHPITSKFGTWGIGSKGVTEDWNEDFEFDDDSSAKTPSVPLDENSGNTSSSVIMVVPDSIKAQQTNVLANIGLLKEWGLLIEELKELRERSISLNLEVDANVEVFDEVDAMIDLADQEAADDGLPTYRSSGQSPTGDFSNSNPASSSPLVLHPIKPDFQEDDVFGPARPTPENKSVQSIHTPDKDNIPVTRARKNSEAVAQSVIRAVQGRGRANGPPASPRTPSRKVPFDTTTLRHIVPYVNGLSKKMKQILRDAEGLQSSPRQRLAPAEPLLRQAFIEPEQDTPVRNISHGPWADGSQDQDQRRLASRMKTVKIHD